MPHNSASHEQKTSRNEFCQGGLSSFQGSSEQLIINYEFVT